VGIYAAMPRFDDSVALAANWKTVLAVDVAMAASVLVVGVILGVASGWWGWLIALAGAVYLFFAGGRVAKWRRIRHRAGL
jgi:hypothetical protein